MSNDKSRGQMIDILVYEVCPADGIREIRLFPDEQAEKDGVRRLSKRITAKMRCGFIRLGRSVGITMKTVNCFLTGNASLR